MLKEYLKAIIYNYLNITCLYVSAFVYQIAIFVDVFARGSGND